MGKLLIIMISAFLALSMSLYAADKEVSFTSADVLTGVSWYNGRYWNNLTDAGKIIYLQGVVETFVECSQSKFIFDDIDLDDDTIDDIRTALSGVVIYNTPYPEIREYINKFYSDQANLNIPILKAYTYMVMGYKNRVTEDERESYLSELKRRFKY